MNDERQKPNILIHVDMDAFYAAVEIRDNPELAGKPLIVGALPSERGVVCTCSYEARVFGVRSAMSIKEAYRLCPQGIYMHPNFHKYKEASRQIRHIWDTYTDIVEYISLDEGFLDVTGSAHLFGGAVAIAQEIKRRTFEETGLTCSVGIGYSKMSAKLASEEKKPDGLFEIATPQALRELIIDRNIRTIYGIGAKTAEKLQSRGITTVRHVYDNAGTIISLLGVAHGSQIIELAEGIDNRTVEAYSEAKSIGSEHTFQHDITDFDYLKDALLLSAEKLSFKIRQQGIYCRTITLKVTYSNMKSITRAKSGTTTDKAYDIYTVASSLLDKIEKRPIRLIGITLSSLTTSPDSQLTLFDTSKTDNQDTFDDAMLKLQQKYGRDIVKSANTLRAKKRIDEND